MTLGEKIKKYRLLHDMTQKELGLKLGFSNTTADVRISQYESGTKIQRDDIRQKIAEVLEVDISALSGIDIQPIEDVVRTFFFMEECLVFKIETFDSDKLYFFNKGKNYYSDREISILNSYMYIWQEQKKNLLNIKNDNQENSNKEYELWKSRFPRDIYIYWNSLMEKIDTYYTPLVDAKGAYKKQTRLALCGTSDVALEAFLESHPEVKVLNFRLDNDEAGKEAVKDYKAKYEQRGYIVNAVFSESKDINEDLIKQSNLTKRAR